MEAVLEPIFEGGGFPMQAPGKVPGGTGPTGTGEGFRIEETGSALPQRSQSTVSQLC